MTAASSGADHKRQYDELMILAMARLDFGDLDEMADLCGAAAKLSPARPEAFCLFGVLAFVSDDFGRSIELLSKAHELDPDMREVSEFLAQVHARAGNLNDAVYFAKIAGTGETSSLLARVKVDGLDDLASALDQTADKSYLSSAQKALSEQRYELAIVECEKEVRLRGASHDVMIVLGQALLAASKPGRAIEAFRAAVHIDPASVQAFLGLAKSLSFVGEPNRARGCLTKAAALADGDPAMSAAVAVVAAQSAIQLESPLPQADPAQKTVAWERKPTASNGHLRVGYLTDCARNVDEMRILEGMLLGMNRETSSAYVYSMDVPGDPMPSRLGNLAAGWLNIKELNNETVIARMQADDLDILFDLTFTEFGARPGVLAAKPARKLVGLFGPKTGALSAAFDCELLHADNPARRDGDQTIKVSPVAVDPETMPPVSEVSPAKERGYVTFGATVDLRYLNPEVASTFAEVLLSVPDSILLLGDRDEVDDVVRERALGYFADQGVLDRVRVEVLEKNANETMVVRRPRFMLSIDVYLEAFPLSAVLPTLDALWGGALVVAMDGRPIDGCASADILRGAGLGEWVASDRNGYVAAAKRAAEESLGDSHRSALIKNIRASSVFDTKAVIGGVLDSLRD